MTKLATCFRVRLAKAKGDVSSYPEKMRETRSQVSGELLECELEVSEISDELERFVVGCGGVVVSSSVRWKVMHVRLPLSALESVAEREDVLAVRRAAGFFRKKTNTSRGDTAHKAASARQIFGVSGRGVKIGVMSDSVRHMSDVQASGDLPSSVDVLDDGIGIGDAGEGTAMLEIVHDLAPNAGLAFCACGSSPAKMADNIARLADAGCRVVVDDIGFYAEPTFSSGPIEVAATEFVREGGVYATSAGNSHNADSGNNGVWEGLFSASSDDATLHEFSAGNSMNKLTSQNRQWISLEWNDTWSGSSNDYALYLYDADGNVVAYSDDTQSGLSSHHPQEMLHTSDLPSSCGGTFKGLFLAVRKKSSANVRRIRINTFGGSLAFEQGGSTYGHSCAEKVLSVGAASVPSDSASFSSTTVPANYSSDGPTWRFFDVAGSAIAGGRMLRKPDVLGAAKVACATPGFESFSGTSAAAPHVAAIVGLMLEANAEMTPQDVFEVLTNSTFSTSGWSPSAGYGALNAEAAVSNAFCRAVQTPDCLYVAMNGNDGNDGRSWTTAKRTIQAAVTSAVDGVTIHVKAGRYQPFSVSGQKALTISSVAGAAQTLIVGSSRRSLSLGTTPRSVLVGFTVTNCSVTAYGGGVSGGILSNCVLRANTASFGGGAYESVLYNCLLTGNTANKAGGGAYRSTLVNCTVVGNSASEEGGGTCFSTVRNSIVWGNSAPVDENVSMRLDECTCTCTAPFLPDGIGNFCADPKFADDAMGDYRLDESSPCIDAGCTADSGGDIDLAGNPRVVGAAVDLGAYEWQGRDVPASTEFPYKLVNGNAIITNYTGTSGDVVFPAVIDGHPVTEIAANAFYYGTYPFVNVTISEGIQKIGHAAFGYCTDLETFSIPSTLTTFGNNVGSEFLGCPAIRSVTVASDNPNYKSVDGVLYNKTGTTLIYCPASKDPYGAFVVPSTVTSIAKYAFDCSKFKTVTLPETITKIDDDVFSCAHNLTTMVVPSGVSSIGQRAFQACYALISVKIPPSVMSIGDYAFGSCTALKTVYVSPGDAQRVASLYSFGSSVEFVETGTTTTYSITYALCAGTHGMTHPTNATYNTVFYVSAPTRPGYTFAGWTVSSGLNASTAKWGTGSNPSTAIGSSSTKCVNGATGNVYFKNLTPTANGSVTLTANWTAVIPLSTALDNTALTFTTGGDAGWFGQSVTKHDGTDAAQSGPITDSQSSWLQTTVTGPGTISFWWYASSESATWDYLSFSVDGVQSNKIGGTSCSWTQCSYALGAGNHVLKWTYRKDGSVSSGLDAGFVDQVVWTPASSGEVYSPVSDFEGMAVGTPVTTGTCEPMSGGVSHWLALGSESTVRDFGSSDVPMYAGTCGQPLGLAGQGDRYLSVMTPLTSPLWRTVNPIVGETAVPREVGESLTFDFLAILGALDEDPDLDMTATVLNGMANFSNALARRNECICLLDDKLAVYLREGEEPEDVWLCVQAGSRNATTGQIEARAFRYVPEELDPDVWNRVSIKTMTMDGYLRFFVYFNGELLSDEAYYARPQTGTALTVTALGFAGRGGVDNIVISERDPVFAGEQAYDVIYNCGTYGSGSQQTATKTQGTALILKGAIFTRAGYTQTGWSTSSTGASKTYDLGASYTTDAAITLYPYWRANTYSITYALGGGTYGTTHPTNATYNTAFYVSAPTRSGYTFAGWTVTSGLSASTAKWGTSSNPSTAISGSSTKCVNGATGNVYFKNLTPTAKGSVTLTANWTAPQSTIYVSMDGSDAQSGTEGAPLATIQAAIDRASAGDVILVGPGTYAPIETSGTRLVIRGADGQPGQTVIDGGGTNRCAYLGSTTNTVLENLTLRNGAAGYRSPYDGYVRYEEDGGGAYGGTLVNCHVVGNKARNGGGCYDTVLRNCKVCGNAASEYGGGACFDYFGGGIAADGCYFSGNSVGVMEDSGWAAGSALYFDFGARGLVRNCIVAENVCGRFGDGGAVASDYGGTDCVLQNCTIVNNRGGWAGGSRAVGVYGFSLVNSIIRFNLADGGRESDIPESGSRLTINGCCVSTLPYSSYSGSGNITADPKFVDLARRVYRLQAGSPCLNAGVSVSDPGATDAMGRTRISENRIDMGACEGVASGVVVTCEVVGEGLVLEPGDVLASNENITFTAAETSRRFMNFSALNGSATTNKVICLTNVMSDTVVFATFERRTFYVDASRPNNLGDGLSWGTAKKTIPAALALCARNDEVIVADGTYGALTVSVEGVTIRSVGGPEHTVIDAAGKGRCVDFVTPDGFEIDAVLEGFTLCNGQTAYAGGGAYGGVLKRCIVRDNVAGTAGGGLYGSRAENTIIVRNCSETFGGGAAYSTLVNCSVAGNRTHGEKGGGLYYGQAVNTVVWGNEAAGVANEYSNGSFTNCVTSPLPSGTGNCSNDPRLVDAVNGDVRLRTGSPLKDAGNPSFMAGNFDVHGNARVQGVKVDVGAIEGGEVVGHVVSVRVKGIGDVSPRTTVVSDGGSVTLTAVETTRPFSHYLLYGLKFSGREQTLTDLMSDLTVTAVFTPYTFYVNAAAKTSGDGLSWANAKRTIQEAVDVAETDETVRVAPGIYSTISTHNKRIVIESEKGPAVTVIDGGQTNRCATLADNSSGRATVLRGFTLTHGVLKESATMLSVYGAGAYAGTLDRCVVSNCQTLAASTYSYGYGAGLAYSRASNTLVVNNIASNYLSHAGTYYADLKNCTVTGNRAVSGTWQYGGTYYGSADNCIIWGNEGGDRNNSYGTTLKYCCVDSSSTSRGTGCVVADPLFVDSANGDYRLAIGSPCIDAGLLGGADVGEVDLDGLARVVNGKIDIGAYEWQNGIVVPPAQGDAVVIPLEWFSTGTIGDMSVFSPSSFVAQFGTDYAAAAKMPTGKVDVHGNPMYVWQDFVAGTDPTDKASKFKASISFVDGKPVITWTPDLNEGGAKSLRTYRTLGINDLSQSADPAAWREVTPGSESAYKFFKVEVDMK